MRDHIYRYYSSYKMLAVLINPNAMTPKQLKELITWFIDNDPPHDVERYDPYAHISKIYPVEEGAYVVFFHYPMDFHLFLEWTSDGE